MKLNLENIMIDMSFASEEVKEFTGCKNNLALVDLFDYLEIAVKKINKLEKEIIEYDNKLDDACRENDSLQEDIRDLEDDIESNYKRIDEDLDFYGMSQSDFV